MNGSKASTNIDIKIYDYYLRPKHSCLVKTRDHTVPELAPVPLEDTYPPAEPSEVTTDVAAMLEAAPFEAIPPDESRSRVLLTLMRPPPLIVLSALPPLL